MEKAASGWINGFIGVAIFAGSLPATRAAVADFDPIFLTCARASIAGLLGLALLLVLGQRRPAFVHLVPLAMTASGVVVGFPLLTALALRHVTSAHSVVFVGLLPLCTAIFGVLRGGERPRPVFWVFSICAVAPMIYWQRCCAFNASCSTPESPVQSRSQRQSERGTEASGCD